MFARTERLLLRPGWAEDAPALARAIADEAIVRNLAKVPWPYSEADVREFLAMGRGPSEPSFLIFERTAAAPRLVGGVAIWRRAEGDHELGYWIAREHWGRGFATEAVRAVLELARDSLRMTHVVALPFMDNHASARVLAKAGFRALSNAPALFSLGRGEVVPCRLFEANLVALPDREEASPRGPGSLDMISRHPICCSAGLC